MARHKRIAVYFQNQRNFVITLYGQITEFSDVKADVTLLSAEQDTTLVSQLLM
jgi:hypothetical protein